MTPEQADDRIVKSRHTLAKYAQMVGAGVVPAPGTGTLVAEEVCILEQIGAEHPSKAAKLESLMAQWREFGDRLKARLH